MPAFGANGRAVSESMRLRDFRRWLARQPKKPAFVSYEYRGFKISGSSGQWFIDNDPRIFTSKAKAEGAVDRCIALRIEMGRDPIAGALVAEERI